MVIPYIGLEKCDLLFFLAKIGVKRNNRILVIDNSIKGDFFSIVKKDADTDIVEEDNLKVMRGYKLGRQAENYDYVFIYEGMQPKYLDTADLVIVAPTTEKTDWDKLEKVIPSHYEEGNRNILFILRDKVNKKVTARTIAKNMGLEEDNCMELWFDEKDYSTYCSLLQNRKVRTSLSSGMYEAVESIATKIYEIDAKQFKKLMNLI